MDDQLTMWRQEVNDYVDNIDFSEGEHLYSNYQDIIGIIVRLQAIHNQIAWEELTEAASTNRKKFRTAILDPTIAMFEKLAAYESRKLTALQIEKDLTR